MKNNSPQSRTAMGALVRLRDQGSNKSLAEFAKDQTAITNVVTKLIPADRPASHDGQGNRMVREPDIHALRSMSEAVSQKDSDSETILQLFPEINNAADILISSIKSPQDMYTEEVNFGTNPGLAVQPILNSIIPAIKAYFTENYNLMDLFDRILRQSLLLSGAHAVAVIPENSLDDLINGKASFSKETLSSYLTDDGFKPVGYLGGNDQPEHAGKFFSMEQLDTGLKTRLAISPQPKANGSVESAIAQAFSYIRISDNPNSLKLKGLKTRLSTERAEMLRFQNMRQNSFMDTSVSRRVSNEGFMTSSKPLNDKDLSQLLYASSRSKHQIFVKAKSDGQLKRYSIGEPLIMELPPGSFVPVIQPGSPDDPIGGFLLFDQDGNPLSRKNQRNHFNDMRNNFKSASGGYTTGQDMASSLLRQAKTNLGTSCVNPTFDQAMQVWSDIVESDLLARLRNGIYGNDVVISSMQEFYRLMLARAMSKQFTQVVFLPKDMITYFTFKTNDDGTGRSLLEDTRIISAMRAQLLFARVMGEIKNSIGRTKVTVSLPEADPNPQETINIVVGEILRNRSITTPTSTFVPSEVASQVSAMGLEFNFEGGTLPDLKVDFEELKSDYNLPSESIEEMLRDRVISGLSVPAELVNSAESAEFATVAISNHLLFAKKVRDIQRVFLPQLEQFVRQVLRADNEFIVMIKKTILESYDTLVSREDIPEEIAKYKDDKNFVCSLLANELISNITVELTRPDTKSIETLQNTFDIHAGFIEKALENIFSPDVTNEAIAGGATMERLDMVKAAFKASLMRQKMIELGIAPEVFDVLSTDEEGKRVFDIVGDVAQHTASLSSIVIELLKKTKTIAQAADSEIEAIGTPEPADSFSSPSSDDGGSDDLGGGGNDDFGLGGGDLDLDGDGTGGSDDLSMDPPADDGSAQDDLSMDIKGL